QGITAKQLDENDAVVYANMDQIRAVVQPKLAENRQEMIAEIERNMANDPQAAPFAPLAKVVAEQFIQAAESFLRDASAATYAVNIGQNGVSTTMLADFKEGSPFAQTVSTLKGSDETLLRGLPAMNYLIFGGYQVDSEALTKAFNDFIAPIAKEVD